MLLVNLERPTPRARYIVRHVFERMLGWPVHLAASLEEFRASTGPKLHYGRSTVEGAFHVPSSGWLEATGAQRPNILHRGTGADLVLFPEGADFDVLAACFYLLGLVEEYPPHGLDTHGRLPVDELFIVRQGAERIPLVDRWVLRLSQELRARLPGLPEPMRQYRHVLTVDVDNGLKYLGRPLHRAVGASLKELLRGDPKAMRERWRVRSGAEVDPYASLADRMTEVAGNTARSIAFFLVRGGGPFDHAAQVTHPAYRELIARVGKHAAIGLHPSHESSVRPALFRDERDHLSAIAGRDVLFSRQHFLRWRVPDTLRTLNELGVTEDHTVGFSDRIGFRAGTCTPFPWYDLEREQETPLMLWPFAAMDSALHERMGRSAEQALAELCAMSDAVREVNGTFISVWHDRYLSGHREFSPWPDMMRRLVQHARA
ncbi:MAG TPA: polysaccharide deacetylase family protein [Flavobacteriales bacterium]|nr:polysaccharide deacetylase family protein [Flavobacteriales bacterium]